MAAPPNHPRLFEAFAHLFEQAAATRALLLVIEHAHWADELSLRLLDFLARRMSAARLPERVRVLVVGRLDRLTAPRGTWPWSRPSSAAKRRCPCWR